MWWNLYFEKKKQTKKIKKQKTTSFFFFFYKLSGNDLYLYFQKEDIVLSPPSHFSLARMDSVLFLSEKENKPKNHVKSKHQAV